MKPKDDDGEKKDIGEIDDDKDDRMKKLEKKIDDYLIACEDETVM